MLRNDSSTPSKGKDGPVATDLDQIASRNSELHSSEDHGRTIQLVIGLDFGTSFSKVIVGEPRVRYAVPFNGYEVGDRPFLLPSALSVLPDSGKCILASDGQDGRLHDNLKMPLIERDFSNEVRTLVAAYLALLLRHARTWLFNTHGAIYKARKVEWFVNIGLPTDSFHDERLISTYRAIVRIAWLLSVLPDDVTLPRALDLLTKDDAHPHNLQEKFADHLLHDDRISAFPEFSAQLAGYVRSPRRRDGLHVTVDIGGGTLDVTVFNVHQSNEEDIYPIFARRVEPLGVRYLATARLLASQQKLNQTLSPFDDLPSDTAFRKRFGITQNQLEKADLPFQKRIVSAVAEPLLYARKYRYPTAPQWDLTSARYGEPVPSFFGGGGALSQFYAALLRGFLRRNPPLTLRASQLPVPDDLEAPGLTQKDYARLAVAYGLSFDPFDIGQIKRMNEVEDVRAEAPRSTFEDRYTSKELT